MSIPIYAHPSFTYGKGLPASKRNPIGRVPVFGSNGIVGYHDSALTDGPTIIIGRKGTAGAVHYSPVPCWPIDTTFFVTGSDASLLRFKYYALRTLGFEHMNSDSAVPGLNRDAAHARELRVLKESEQRAIAHILGSLDDKIELNHRMNETLAAMAQTVFKSWFINFDPIIDNALAAGNPIPEALQPRAKIRRSILNGTAERNGYEKLSDTIRQRFPSAFEYTEEIGYIPKGWRIGPVSELATLNPESWTVKTAPDYIQYVDLANTKNGRIKLAVPYEFSEAPSRARRVLRRGDTIIGIVRPGNRSFAYIHNNDLTGSTGFAVMRPKNDSFRAFVFLHLTRDEIIDHFAHLADGAAYPAIRPEVVAKLKCVLPSKKLLENFETLTHPWFGCIGTRESQTNSLAELRDTLLPKLVSGELRLREAEKFLDLTNKSGDADLKAQIE